MTAYRFVHAADVHLNSPLRSLALRDPRLAEFVGNASRQVFSRIVELVPRRAGEMRSCSPATSTTASRPR